jgi:two-component system chemotaxis response regulator CheY
MSDQVKRAVVVEDDASTRQLVQFVLRSIGFTEIVEAENGQEAITALQACKADLALIDWQMDVMDGLECTRRIRAGVEGIDPRLIIILLTGLVGKENEKLAYEAGVDLFLEKPFSVKMMHAGVSKALGKRV